MLLTDFYFETRTESEVKKNWIAAKEKLSFSVQACRNVKLVLSPFPRTTTLNSIVIWIGKKLSNYTLVEIGDAGQRNVTTVEVPPEILLCIIPNTFWVHWSNGLVRLGQGSIIGENFIAQHDIHHIPDTAEVRAVGMSTDKVPYGLWQIKSHTGLNLKFVLFNC